MYISKTTLAIVCAAVIAFIILTCHYSSAPVQGSSEKVDTLEWVNNAGDIVSSLKADPSYFAKDREHLIDSLSMIYKTTPNKIIEYVTVYTEGDNNIQPTGPAEADYFPMDTAKDCPPQIKSMRQAFSSPYYKALVQVGDSSFMRLQTYDTVTVLWKKVNEGSIFNRRSLLQLDVSTANPDTKVSGIKAYRITEKPKKWAIGIQFGYGISLTDKGINPSPMISVGVTKTLIRF